MTFPAVPRFPVQPILLGVGFALLVAIGTATVWLAEQSAQDARSVVHTINVQENLSNLLLNVRRAESGQRGFLLTVGSNISWTIATPRLRSKPTWPSCER
jgi:hypothetical protein